MSMNQKAREEWEHADAEKLQRVDEVANMRHNALLRRCISSLTRGGPGEMPRPIEVHAHDPLRYVANMLDWLFQMLLIVYVLGYIPINCNSDYMVLKLC